MPKKNLDHHLATLVADPLIRRARVIHEARPDLAQQIRDGKMTIKQAEREMLAPRTQRIYFIEEPRSGAVTIGLSASVAEHLTRLQLGNPTELVLLASPLGTAADLRRLRRRLGAWRVRGEWYRQSPYLQRLIEVARG